MYYLLRLILLLQVYIGNHADDFNSIEERADLRLLISLHYSWVLRVGPAYVAIKGRDPKTT